MEDNELTPEQNELECLKEIEEVLKKYKCEIQVAFEKHKVIGNTVLKYHPTIVYKGIVKP